MNFKKTTLATMMSVGLALSAGQAAANIVGVAGIDIRELNVVILEGDGSLATITNFDFRTSNAADLNGASDNDIDSCGGTVASNSCNSGAGPVLNSDIISFGAAAYTGIGENTFAFVAPAGVEGSAADSVVSTAQLVNLGSPTAVTHLSQAELTTGSSAGAEANISSTTGFTLDFNLTSNDGFLSFFFEAEPELYAELIDPTASGGTASANHTVEFRLTGSNGESLFWNPNGSVDGNCIAFGGPACAEVADLENLNALVSAPFGSSDQESFNGAFDAYGFYQIDVTGLAAGTWSLSLATSSRTNLTRTAVPAPGVLLLLGTGLAGLGFIRRRKNKMA